MLLPVVVLAAASKRLKRGRLVKRPKHLGRPAPQARQSQVRLDRLLSRQGLLEQARLALKHLLAWLLVRWAALCPVPPLRQLRRRRKKPRLSLLRTLRLPLTKA